MFCPAPSLISKWVQCEAAMQCPPAPWGQELSTMGALWLPPPWRWIPGLLESCWLLHGWQPWSTRGSQLPHGK